MIANMRFTTYLNHLLLLQFNRVFLQCFICQTYKNTLLFRAKYQKNVEASHNKGIGMKQNIVPCIRSENYLITFEVEEEKYGFNDTFPFSVILPFIHFTCSRCYILI